jgi:hypothetical protein
LRLKMRLTYCQAARHEAKSGFEYVPLSVIPRLLL